MKPFYTLLGVFLFVIGMDLSHSQSISLDSDFETVLNQHRQERLEATRNLLEIIQTEIHNEAGSLLRRYGQAGSSMGVQGSREIDFNPLQWQDQAQAVIESGNHPLLQQNNELKNRVVLHLNMLKSTISEYPGLINRLNEEDILRVLSSLTTNQSSSDNDQIIRQFYEVFPQDTLLALMDAYSSYAATNEAYTNFLNENPRLLRYQTATNSLLVFLTERFEEEAPNELTVTGMEFGFDMPPFTQIKRMEDQGKLGMKIQFPHYFYSHEFLSFDGLYSVSVLPDPQTGHKPNSRYSMANQTVLDNDGNITKIELWIRENNEIRSHSIIDYNLSKIFNFDAQERLLEVIRLDPYSTQERLQRDPGFTIDENFIENHWTWRKTYNEDGNENIFLNKENLRRVNFEELCSNPESPLCFNSEALDALLKRESISRVVNNPTDNLNIVNFLPESHAIIFLSRHENSNQLVLTTQESRTTPGRILYIDEFIQYDFLESQYSIQTHGEQAYLGEGSLDQIRDVYELDLIPEPHYNSFTESYFYNGILARVGEVEIPENYQPRGFFGNLAHDLTNNPVFNYIFSPLLHTLGEIGEGVVQGFGGLLGMGVSISSNLINTGLGYAGIRSNNLQYFSDRLAFDSKNALMRGFMIDRDFQSDPVTRLAQMISHLSPEERRYYLQEFRQRYLSHLRNNSESSGNWDQRTQSLLETVTTNLEELAEDPNFASFVINSLSGTESGLEELRSNGVLSLMAAEGLNLSIHLGTAAAGGIGLGMGPRVCRFLGGRLPYFSRTFSILEGTLIGAEAATFVGATTSLFAAGLNLIDRPNRENLRQVTNELLIFVGLAMASRYSHSRGSELGLPEAFELSPRARQMLTELPELTPIEVNRMKNQILEQYSTLSERLSGNWGETLVERISLEIHNIQSTANSLGRTGLAFELRNILLRIDRLRSRLDPNVELGLGVWDAIDYPVRMALAEILHGELTSLQRGAVWEAHLTARNELGRDGTPARFGNYTRSQLASKVRHLREAGITNPRLLAELGVVGQSIYQVSQALSGARSTESDPLNQVRARLDWSGRGFDNILQLYEINGQRLGEFLDNSYQFHGREMSLIQKLNEVLESELSTSDGRRFYLTENGLLRWLEFVVEFDGNHALAREAFLRNLSEGSNFRHHLTSAGRQLIAAKIKGGRFPILNEQGVFSIQRENGLETLANQEIIPLEAFQRIPSLFGEAPIDTYRLSDVLRNYRIPQNQIMDVLNRTYGPPDSRIRLIDILASEWLLPKIFDHLSREFRGYNGRLERSPRLYELRSQRQPRHSSDLFSRTRNFGDGNSSLESLLSLAQREYYAQTQDGYITTVEIFEQYLTNELLTNWLEGLGSGGRFDSYLTLEGKLSFLEAVESIEARFGDSQNPGRSLWRMENWQGPPEWLGRHLHRSEVTPSSREIWRVRSSFESTITRNGLSLAYRNLHQRYGDVLGNAMSAYILFPEGQVTLSNRAKNALAQQLSLASHLESILNPNTNLGRTAVGIRGLNNHGRDAISVNSTTSSPENGSALLRYYPDFSEATYQVGTNWRLQNGEMQPTSYQTQTISYEAFQVRSLEGNVLEALDSLLRVETDPSRVQLPFEVEVWENFIQQELSNGAEQRVHPRLNGELYVKPEHWEILEPLLSRTWENSVFDYSHTVDRYNDAPRAEDTLRPNDLVLPLLRWELLLNTTADFSLLREGYLSRLREARSPKDIQEALNYFWRNDHSNIAQQLQNRILQTQRTN